MTSMRVLIPNKVPPCPHRPEGHKWKPQHYKRGGRIYKTVWSCDYCPVKMVTNWTDKP